MNHVLTFPRQDTSMHSAKQQMLRCCWLSPFHWRIHWWSQLSDFTKWSQKILCTGGKLTIWVRRFLKEQFFSSHGEVCSVLRFKLLQEEGADYRAICLSLQLCIFQLRKNVHMNKDKICMRTKMNYATTWETQVISCNTPAKQSFLQITFFSACVGLLEISNPQLE